MIATMTAARTVIRQNKSMAVTLNLTYTSAMRNLSYVAVFLMASGSVANAQQTTPAEGPSWSKLEGLKPGVGISVKAVHHSGSCNFKSATETDLTCLVSGVAVVYPRAERQSVKQHHRGRSTLAGFAIGAAGGALVGAPLGQSGSFVGHGAAAVIVAIPGAIIGTIVGVSTDFTHSTVYRAP